MFQIHIQALVTATFLTPGGVGGIKQFEVFADELSLIICNLIYPPTVISLMYKNVMF